MAIQAIQAMSPVSNTVCIPKCKQQTHLVAFGIATTPGVSLFGPVLPIYGVDPCRWSSMHQLMCWVHRRGLFCRCLIYLILTPIASALTLGFSCTPYPYPHKPIPVEVWVWVLTGTGMGQIFLPRGYPGHSLGLGLASDKGRIGLYIKLCDFTLLFMILQVELKLNKDH